MNRYILYRIKWTEYERGFGQREDGYTFHSTKDLANKFIKNYWDRMPKKVVDVYSSPSAPELVEVSREVYERILAEEKN